MSLDSLSEIRIRLREFVAAREWAQFHSPKNLSCALSVEAAELLEIFQWERDEANPDLSSKSRERAAEELADVLFYLIMLADRLEIDLPRAAEAKLVQNAEKYPVALARGRSTKHDELKS